MPVSSQNLTQEQIIETLRHLLPHLQQQYGVARMALFGSFAQQSAHAASDVDILVELQRPLGLAFVTLAEELEASLGRKVDLGTFEDLRRSHENPRYRHIAQTIEETLLYVAPQA